MAGKVWLTYEFSPAMLTKPDMVLHWKKLESSEAAAKLTHAARKAGTLVTAVRKEDVARDFEKWLGLPIPVVSVQIKFMPGDVIMLGKIYGWNTQQQHRGSKNVEWFLIIVHDKTFAPPAKSDLDALKLAPEQLDNLRQRGLFDAFRTEIREGQTLRCEVARLEGALRDIEQMVGAGATPEEVVQHVREANNSRLKVTGMKPYAWLTAESPERIALSKLALRDQSGNYLHSREDILSYGIDRSVAQTQAPKSGTRIPRESASASGAHSSE